VTGDDEGRQPDEEAIIRQVWRAKGSGSNLRRFIRFLDPLFQQLGRLQPFPVTILEWY
jgi:hypothetical protein